MLVLMLTTNTMFGCIMQICGRMHYNELLHLQELARREGARLPHIKMKDSYKIDTRIQLLIMRDHAALMST